MARCHRVFFTAGKDDPDKLQWCFRSSSLRGGGLEEEKLLSIAHVVVDALEKYSRKE
jgi:hypothetical protein